MVPALGEEILLLLGLAGLTIRLIGVVLAPAGDAGDDGALVTGGIEVVKVIVIAVVGAVVRLIPLECRADGGHRGIGGHHPGNVVDVGGAVGVGELDVLGTVHRHVVDVNAVGPGDGQLLGLGELDDLRAVHRGVGR